MSEAGLTDYAQAGLVISMATFVGIVVWVLRRPREEMEARARGVFEDGELPVDAGGPAAEIPIQQDSLDTKVE